MRIGVVADTHVGEHLPELPGEVCEVLAGVDLILHAGDIVEPSVLDELGAVAPVVAVRGNHDERTGHRDLPRDVLVRVGGARIGLTHGHRPAAVELPAIALSLAAGRPVRLGFERTMAVASRAPTASWWATSTSRSTTSVGGVLLFSPGAVFSAEHDPEYDWREPGADGLPPLPPRLPPEPRRPAVGLIEVGPGVLRARVIHLLRPIRAAA